MSIRVRLILWPSIVFAVSLIGLALVIWRSLDSTETARDDLRLVLILTVPAFLVVSVVGGWLLSRNALRPVDDVTEAARRVSLKDLSGSLPVPSHGDELQRLCEAWNEMLRRLDDSARQFR